MFLFRLFQFFTPFLKWRKPVTTEVSPHDYGWTFHHTWNNKNTYIFSTKFCNFYLTQTDYGWTFDKDKKNSPGVIARFDFPLLEADLQYMKAHIEARIETYKNT